MIQATLTAPASLGAPHASSAIADASIAAYLAAGERMRIVAQWVGIACVGLLVIIAVAWAMGLLPKAVELL